MNNNDVLIGFALDSSSSMEHLTDATIEGFNSILTEQRALPGTALLSLTVFNTSFEVRYVATPVITIPKMSRHQPNKYAPSGGTALLDGVGLTVKGIEKWQRQHPAFEGAVKIITLTDGGENSSSQWHISQPPVDGDDKDLLGLIRWKQSEGWEFIFVGTGGSDWLERTFGGVVPVEAFYANANTEYGTQAVYSSLNSAMTRSRAGGQSIGSSLADDPSNLRNH